jgi:hypothetical protein
VIWLITHLAVNNATYIERFVLTAQRCLLGIVALHTSLPTIRNSLRSLCKVTVALCKLAVALCKVPVALCKVPVALCKVPVALSGFQKISFFLGRFSWKCPSNFTKICLVGAAPINEYRWTEGQKLRKE